MRQISQTGKAVLYHSSPQRGHSMVISALTMMLGTMGKTTDHSELTSKSHRRKSSVRVCGYVQLKTVGLASNLKH